MTLSVNKLSINYINQCAILEISVGQFKMNEANNFKIIKRGRGSVLLFSGYQFYRNTVYSNKSSYWRCKNYKNKTHCNGYVTLSHVSMLINNIVPIKD